MFSLSVLELGYHSLDFPIQSFIDFTDLATNVHYAEPLHVIRTGVICNEYDFIDTLQLLQQLRPEKVINGGLQSTSISKASPILNAEIQKHLLQSDALNQYILETSVYPREPECLKELREVTAKHPHAIAALPAHEGQFLMLLLKLINAKKTIEIGVFTGCSLLCTALALPPDGKVIGIDINRESYDLGRPIIEKAGIAHKIDFKEGPALPILDELIQNVGMLGSFDFAFVDADKDNYLNYHERLLRLVKIGGLVCFDNSLWCGAVAGPVAAMAYEEVRKNTPYVIEMNKGLAGDKRIELCQLPIGDGLTLCRRIS